MNGATYTALAFIIGILVGMVSGLVAGWFASDKYNTMLIARTHDFEELFEKNPHPEIFDEKGKINRSDYMSINFDLGYDPDDFDPEDIISEG
jgi:hypothetical protein